METGGVHVYEFTFSSLCSDMLQRKQELFLPKKKDYLYVKKKFNNIDKKIVCINGRNLYGNRAMRNNTFFDLIKFLIENDFFIVNCTLPQPQFTNNFIKETYIEISEDELLDYSINVSYFLNSNYLISIANSGGITNHICTKSNIILFGEGGWVDNPKFGSNNKSIYDVSKELKPTYKTNNFDEIKNIINNSSRPDNINFFDESKIITF